MRPIPCDSTIVCVTLKIDGPPNSTSCIFGGIGTTHATWMWMPTWLFLASKPPESGIGRLRYSGLGSEPDTVVVVDRLTAVMPTPAAMFRQSRMPPWMSTPAAFLAGYSTSTVAVSANDGQDCVWLNPDPARLVDAVHREVPAVGPVALLRRPRRGRRLAAGGWRLLAQAGGF